MMTKNRKGKVDMDTDRTSTHKNASFRSNAGKYLGAAVLAGLASSLIGDEIRKKKIEEKKEKAKNISRNKSSIVVPISKANFMKDLIPPDVLAKTRGDSASGIDAGKSTSAIENVDAPKQLDDLSASDIEAKKKAILKERKFDFFRNSKAASSDAGSDSGKTSEGDASSKEHDSVPAKDGDKDDGDGKRMYLRDQTGKFVSPTDPVAVEQVAKEAEVEGIGDVVLHPFKSIGKALNGATEKPVLFSAGLIGSVYIASRIADAINARRREKSKEELDAARDKYVDLLEEGNSEKTAWDLSETSGQLIGGAFFVPMALTAIITNRIIENRKKENKRQKSVSDSYPDDPVILYKTSEGKDEPIDAGTALMLIMVKRGMILDAERAEADAALEKIAQQKSFSDEDYARAIRRATDYVKDDDNADDVIDMIDNHRGYGESGSGPSVGWWKKPLMRAGNWLGLNEDPDIYESPEFKRRLAKSPEFQDALRGQFGSNKKFIEYKNRSIDNYLSKNWKLQKGGLLHTILSWLAKNFGIGDWMFNREMNKALSSASEYMSPEEELAAEREKLKETGGRNLTVIRDPQPKTDAVTPQASGTGVSIPAQTSQGANSEPVRPPTSNADAVPPQNAAPENNTTDAMTREMALRDQNSPERTKPIGDVPAPTFGPAPVIENPPQVNGGNNEVLALPSTQAANPAMPGGVEPQSPAELPKTGPYIGYAPQTKSSPEITWDAFKLPNGQNINQPSTTAPKNKNIGDVMARISKNPAFPMYLKPFLNPTGK